jgi:hypothetical protein
MISAQCERAGCQLILAKKAAKRAGDLLRDAEYLHAQRRRGKELEATMSKALWCDAGEHPFSERDGSRQHLERTIVNEAGDQVTEPWDVCGTCAEQNGLLRPRTLYPGRGAPSGPITGIGGGGGAAYIPPGPTPGGPS